MVALFAIAVSLVGSFPVLTTFVLVLPILQLQKVNIQIKIGWLILITLCIALIYSLIPTLLKFHFLQLLLSGAISNMQNFVSITAILFLCANTAIILSIKHVVKYLSIGAINTSTYFILLNQILKHSKKTNNNMSIEQNLPQQTNLPEQQTPKSNSLIIKGIITGVLILVMLIPTLFINNLISERENRQKEVVKEVSSKWAAAQTLSAPFITVPYSTQYTNTDGKLKTSSTNLILLADQLNVQATINPEIRPRSIYKVLLYKSIINFNGSFKPDWPADINIANIDFTKAKLCFALSDYKGIEEEIFINYNGIKYLLNPTLPITDFGEVGLSVPMATNVEQLKLGAAFNMQLKLKGSEQLHFLPLSSNSLFNIKSGWPNPSFDGNSLPNTRTYNDSGFTASWKFNRANLPFGTVLKEGVLKATNTAFGVTLVQPADQ